MFEWLHDYRQLSDEITFLEYNLDRNYKELKRWTSGDLTNVKLSADSIAARLEESIQDVEYELAHKMNDLHDMKKLIATFSGLDNQILFKKYVEGKTLECAAEELNYSTQYIYNKHAQIKKMVSYSNAVKMESIRMT